MKLINTVKIVELCKPFLLNSEEGVVVVLLDRSLAIVETKLVQKGASSEVCFDIRSVVEYLTKVGAFGGVLVHNHPNGKDKPSENDLRITKIFVDACDEINIKVFDHIIIGSDACFSFAKHNILV